MHEHLLEDFCVCVVYSLLWVVIMPVAKQTQLSFEQQQAQAVHGYPSSLVLNVQWMIDQGNAGEVPVITANEDIYQILKDQKIVRDEMVNSDEVFCHPSNRGQLGLNAYNVHKNGREIKTVGVKLSELHSASSFELCPLEPKRSEQIQFNAKLINKAQGLLSQPTGKESKLSVGGGHFAGYIRAVKAGCRTPFKDMQDSTGCLSREQLCKKDPRMKECCDGGWMQRVYPWGAEYAWPKLPDLVQRALNASHTVTSRSTELEVMVWFTEQIKDLEADDTVVDNVLEAVQSSGPACQSYLRSVAALAKQIGSQRVLFFLDRFFEDIW